MMLPHLTVVRKALVLGVSALGLGSSGATAQDPSLPMPPAFLKTMEPMIPRAEASDRVVSTRHSVEIAGQTIAYDAIVTETPVANDNGEPAAVVVTFAYVANDRPDRSKRPVLFIFNGGPGASSSPLHLKGFGPRRISGEGASAAFRDNTHSLLDIADLVFIDPPGTGTSMPIAGADASSLFSTTGDAQAVATVVKNWLEVNDRAESPYALIGESYGTARALAMLPQFSKLGFRLPEGVGLLSLAIGGSSGPVISDVILLPTLAAVAWYHGAVDRDGRTVEEQFELALDFARGDYARALLLGPEMPAVERGLVGKRLSELIGLPAEQLLENNLRLDRQVFMLGLLAKEGVRTGQLDARARRLISESNMHPPFDDPSMKLGTETQDLLTDYLTEDLGYSPPSPYRTLNLGINFKWNYGPGGYASSRFVPYLARALEEKESLSLFTGGGYYDITTPVFAGIFALNDAGIPPEQRSSHAYAAGHSVFEDDAGLEAMSSDLRAWISGLKRQPD